MNRVRCCGRPAAAFAVRVLILALAPGWLVPGIQAATLDEVSAQLSANIERAQRALSETEARVSRERGELARKINAAQNRVLDLRDRTVAARRAADEETLSLQQIRTRLDAWQDQSQFQTRLLAGFLDRGGKRALATADGLDLQSDLGLFAEYLTDQQQRLYPGWREATVVMPDGQLEAASVLALGPVQWFWQADRARGGLLKKQNALLAASLIFDDETGTGIDVLQQRGSGAVTFDPTLTRALLLVDGQESVMQHLQKGGIWVIPILLFALFATVTAVGKAITLYRLSARVPALAERTASALQEGSAAVQEFADQVRGYQGELLRIALQSRTAQQREDRLYATLLEQRNRLERWLGAIAMTASVSPLLGLLGTVSGMIATFKLMTLFGAGDPSAVSAGISEALVTTELGLVVAIPALLAHALMSRHVKSYFAGLENDAVHLSQLPLPESGA